MRKIILASSSPRRREILQKLRIPFVVEVSTYEEDMTLPLAPKNLVKHLAYEKASAVAIRHKDAIVIGADTVAVLDGEVLGKAHTKQRIKEMVRKLNGKMHSMITGYAIIDTRTGKRVRGCVETKLYFKKISKAEIDAYAELGESLDTAGGFSMQGFGGSFITKVSGDYYNIIGLPLSTIADELKKFL